MLPIIKITSEAIATNQTLPDGKVDNSLPLNLLIDEQGDLWGVGEFNQHFYHVSDVAHSAKLDNVQFPRINPKPFLLPLKGKINNSFSSQFGEKVLLVNNDKGRVIWFSRGGAYCITHYGSDEFRPIEENWGHDANYSEIVAWYPDAEEPYFEVYRLPKGWSNVSGLYWDENKQELWFLEFSHDRNQPHISVLRPYDFNFRRGSHTPLMHPAKETAWEHFLIPPEFHSVAHLCEDSEGCFWFTGYLSSNIGCFNPRTKTFWCLPLPRASRGHHKGKGPWDIHCKTINHHEYLFVSEFYDASVSIIDLPAIREFFVDNPGEAVFPAEKLNEIYKQRCFAEPVVSHVNEVHSLCFDADNRLWFTTSNIEKPAATGLVGCLVLGDDVFSSWENQAVELMQIIDIDQEGNSAFTGIAVAQVSGKSVIVVADQFAKKLRKFFI